MASHEATMKVSSTPQTESGATTDSQSQIIHLPWYRFLLLPESEQKDLDEMAILSTFEPLDHLPQELDGSTGTETPLPELFLGIPLDTDMIFDYAYKYELYAYVDKRTMGPLGWVPPEEVTSNTVINVDSTSYMCNVYPAIHRLPPPISQTINGETWTPALASADSKLRWKKGTEIKAQTRQQCFALWYNGDFYMFRCRDDASASTMRVDGVSCSLFVCLHRALEPRILAHRAYLRPIFPLTTSVQPINSTPSHTPLVATTKKKALTAPPERDHCDRDPSQHAARLADSQVPGKRARRNRESGAEAGAEEVVPGKHARDVERVTVLALRAEIQQGLPYHRDHDEVNDEDHY
ncbi:hypothetical protein PUNSTDRAFT_44718 [Punctularia strigosozonata HHB-11173 SS5]|uniref:uncharacterized protein n=1 Tax=Punctularia strigosozonata (strain HHB-11173) TaxID=741275 RepID=UPI0004417F0E|nr:uncharacterized protein PUNSTDRAFT_44718 [Punctularia strigosozonata HHB-11173 SS5]EIN09359.1 hypothetical protein PUNSTDRAFT_44718 [Punctularia strigosozonata HHB-11173 SS5]